MCEADPGPAPDDEPLDEAVEFPEGIPDVDGTLRGCADDLAGLVDLRDAIWSKGEVLDMHLANSYVKAQDGISKLRRILLDAGISRRDAVLIDRREKRLVRSARGASH